MLNFIKKLRKKSKPSYRSGWNTDGNIIEVGGAFIQDVTYSTGTAGSKPEEKKDTRIVKKPVEVFKEIISETPKLDLSDLDGKIKVVKERIRVFRDVIGGADTNDETEALIFLEARKKLLKTKKNEFGWQTTNLKMIESLCNKYKLKMVDFNSYCKNVPMEAVDELDKFYKVYKKISKSTPVLKLIIDDGGKETKKDPILLASSPFGKWYYILGAWDKEVEIVDDLIYNGK